MSNNSRVDKARINSDAGQVARRSMVDVGHWIDQKGWCPATGGNFSVRLSSVSSDDVALGDSCVVTASGCHKGQLKISDFIEVDLYGQPIDPDDPHRPSAETLVHVALYRLSSKINAVLHAHSIPNTVLSRIEKGNEIRVQGWEMQKALRGETTHEKTSVLAIFSNTQDMQALAESVEKRWVSVDGLHWGFLVRGHGVYAWGETMEEARRHLEAIEFLLSCELEMRRLTLGVDQS